MTQLGLVSGTIGSPLILSGLLVALVLYELQRPERLADIADILLAPP